MVWIITATIFFYVVYELHIVMLYVFGDYTSSKNYILDLVIPFRGVIRWVYNNRLKDVKYEKHV